MSETYGVTLTGDSSGFRAAVDAAKAPLKSLGDEARKAGEAIRSNLGSGASAGARVAGSALSEAAKQASRAASEHASAARNFRYNLINIGNSAIATRGNLIAMSSALPDVVQAFTGLAPATQAAALGYAGVAAAAAAVLAPLALGAARIAENESRLRSLSATLTLSGRASGQFAAELKAQADALADGGPFGRAETFEAARQLAGHTRLTRDQMEKLLPIAANLAQATGVALPEAAERLASGFDAGLKGIQALDQQFGLLTAAEDRQVRQLFEAGREGEAFNLVIEKLEERTRRAAAEGLSPLDEGLAQVRERWDALVDALGRGLQAIGAVDAISFAFRHMGEAADIAAKSVATLVGGPLAAAALAAKQLFGGDAAAPAATPGYKTGGGFGADDDQAIQARLKEQYRRADEEAKKAAEEAARRAKAQADADARAQQAKLERQTRVLALLGREAEMDERLAEAKRSGSAADEENARRQAQIGELVDRLGLSYEQAAAAVNRLAEARRRLATETSLADLKAEVGSAEALTAALGSGNRAAVRSATIEGQASRFASQNGLSSDDSAVGRFRDLKQREYADALKREAQAASQAADATVAYNAAVAKLNELRESGALSSAAYEEGLKKAEADRLAASKDFESGARRALRAYADEAGDAAKQAEQAVTGAFRSMEDAMVEFTTTGKLNFSAMASSILADLVRIQARAAIGSLFGGGQGGGLLGSLFGSLFGGGSSAGAGGGSLQGADLSAFSAQGNVFERGRRLTAFRSGGVVSRPTLFPMASGGVGLMGEAGPEAVLPLRRLPGGDLGVKAEGSGGGGVHVQIIDQRSGDSAPVQTSGSGRRDDPLQVIIPALRRDLAQRGPLAQSLEQTYGMSRRPGGR